MKPPSSHYNARKPELKAIARTPELPRIKEFALRTGTRAADPVPWLGARVRNIAGEGEMSAFGLPGVTGVLVLEVPAESPLAKSGLQKNDVILSVNGGKTADAAALLKQAPAWPANDSLKLGVSRDQKDTVIVVVR